MSEMIERVARAICRSDADWEGNSWKQHVNEARAAIEAMRVPTQEMKEAVRLVGGTQALAYGLAAWPTMIDAALKENP